MITLALPWVMALAAVGALTVAALHWLSVRRPPELLLPTARFLPERDVRAVSRTRRPSDLWLLVLRVLLVLAAGLAIAGPGWKTTDRRSGIVVVVGPGVVRDTLAIRQAVLRQAVRRQAVRRQAPPADAAMSIVFTDSAAASAPNAPAAITTLFPVAIRAAAHMVRDDAAIDSLELHLFSREGVVDRMAFEAWRSAWNGRVVTHTVADRPPLRRVMLVDSGGRPINAMVPERAGVVRLREDDVVTTALAWHASRVSSARAVRVDTVQLVRGARGVQRARVLLEWPENGVPSGWLTLRTVDSAAAMVAGGAVVDGPWPVPAVPDAGDTAIAIAWWSDGQVAATERQTASGCDRRVALVSDGGSDALIAATADRLFDRLLAPCPDKPLVAVGTLAVQSTDGTRRAPAESFRSTNAADRTADRTAGSPIPPWITPVLLGASLVLLLLEWRVRRQRVPRQRVPRQRAPVVS